MKPIKIRVKEPWQGMVGVRDKYIQQMAAENRGLLITCKGEQMLIRREELGDRILKKSKKPFVDRFSNKLHYLFYFDWKPDSEQGKLI